MNKVYITKKNIYIYMYIYQVILKKKTYKCNDLSVAEVYTVSGVQ